jgi:Carboxypeptidase regulatory-like domain/TonB-dependent Receptor Plug Domain
MRKFTFTTALLLCWTLLSLNAFAQTTDATVGGTVSDATGALIPGVTITATNTATGIVKTTLSNESGAYNFPALQTGTYKLSAELTGFKTQAYADFKLGGAQQARLNFTLQVGAAVGTSVEVASTVDSALVTSANSIGTVLSENQVRDLPTIAGNVFNLVQNMPGVQRDGTGTFGYMAGGRLGDVNTTRDGVNVNDGRYENGAWSTVYSSPDMIEEVKVVVAPVDAETSRGSGQVSMVTRSGTNKYTGSVFWNNHNSALDANEWFQNANGTAKSFDNRNQYGARFSGPIIKNKTFFFALFEGQRDMKRNSVVGSLTWTDMAKAGIFRYYPKVDNQNFNQAVPTVDNNGNPVKPAAATDPFGYGNSLPYAIGLFGSCSFQGALVPNCKTFSDPNRPGPAVTAFLQEEFKRMPSPNNFKTGDGLNTAGINFTRRQVGLDATNGNSDEVNRDQYNLRIDHNFNSKHKLSLIGTNEHTWGAATQAGLRNWPDSYDGLAVKRPVVYSIQLTSTLTNSLLNQLRLSKSGTNNWQWGPANRGDAVGAEALSLVSTASGIPYRVTFATGIGSFDEVGGFGRWREGINPRYSIGDDLSWTVSNHAFKGGYEFRRTNSNGFNDPNMTPSTTYGGGTNPAIIDATTNNLCGTGCKFTDLTANAATTAKNILYDLSGSVANVNQAFGVLSAQDTVLRSTPVIPNNRHWNIQNEMSAYFKDDWKFRKNLTLNLGIHWEWYGSAYEKNGLAARVVGDTNSFLNVTCAPGVLTPSGAYDSANGCTNLATVQFVGKNSTHPEIQSNVHGTDNNNFAPSAGFSWNVPWFGEGKTVLRGGYGISYEGALRNFITVDGVIGTVPGINLISGGTGLTYTPATFTNTSTLTLPIPFPTGTPTSSPFPVPTTARNLGITTYNMVSPYTQNWNLEVQRELTKRMSVSVRYVGTKGTKITSNVDLNTLGWYKNEHTAALLDAFNTVRQGGESPLLDQMFNGIGFTGTCVGGTVTAGVTCTGATIARTFSTTRGQLANGTFGAFLGTLNTGNYTQSLVGGVVTQNTNSDSGNILRHAGLPDNYLVPDPQYSSVSVTQNPDNSTYHSLNVQFTQRLTRGFTNTTTYIWSKAMGPGGAIDPFHQNTKQLQAVDHKGQISSNGTYELPFGANHYVAGNAPGWVQGIVNNMQVSGIMNYTTGAPLSITGISTIAGGTGNPVVVGDLKQNLGGGKIAETSTGVNYFDGWTTVVDPGLSLVSPLNGLTAGFSNRALQDPAGNIVLVNAQPGQAGNFGAMTVRGPGRFDLDMNVVKRVRIDESKSLELRLDVVNVMNHPNFNNPGLSINSTGTFGRITSLASGQNIGGNGGMRSFVINTRFNF